MNNRNFAFGPINFILLAIGMIIIVAGFILMSGSGSAEGVFDPDIFSTRRICVAPAVCFFGFIFMIVAILFKTPEKKDEKNQQD